MTTDETITTEPEPLSLMARDAIAAGFDAPELARHVAALLGPEWAPRDPFANSPDAERRSNRHCTYEIARGDGAAIRLHYLRAGYSGKRSAAAIAWTGEYPERPDGGDYGPSHGGREARARIYTSTTRPAKALAADLTRRLLPDYLRQYGEACARRDNAMDGAAHARQTAEQLQAVLGYGWRKPRAGFSEADRGLEDSYEFPVPVGIGEVYGDITVSWGGSVKIELRGLSAEQATQMLAAFKEASTCLDTTSK